MSELPTTVAEVVGECVCGNISKLTADCCCHCRHGTEAKLLLDRVAELEASFAAVSQENEHMDGKLAAFAEEVGRLRQREKGWRYWIRMHTALLPSVVRDGLDVEKVLANAIARAEAEERKDEPNARQ